MKVIYGRDFSDDELRRISGRKRTATRKEVKAWIDALIASWSEGLADPTVKVVEIDSRTAAQRVMHAEHSEGGASKVCTPMDHCFPARYLPPDKGTECYCGKRRW